MDAFEELETRAFEADDSLGLPPDVVEDAGLDFELGLHDPDKRFTDAQLLAFAEATDMGTEEPENEDQIPSDEIAAVRLQLAQLGFSEEDIALALDPELEADDDAPGFQVPGTRKRAA